MAKVITNISIHAKKVGNTTSSDFFSRISQKQHFLAAFSILGENTSNDFCVEFDFAEINLAYAPICLQAGLRGIG